MTGLDSIDHVILLMLENRSFDHLLGDLYPKSDTFDGLDGTERLIPSGDFTPCCPNCRNTSPSLAG